ncbi:hypothetical protein LINGRAHAP2_LOCUS9942 [Linum grandiflorum]
MAEEEFGTASTGPIQVPCEEELMVSILSLLRKEGCPDDNDHVSSINNCNGGSSFASIFLTIHSQFT